MDTSIRPEFRRKLNSGTTLFAPHCPDPLVARLCERLGYDAGYLGGAGLGHRLAVSEALLNVSDLASATSAVRLRSDLPLVVDGGVGFGDAIHVQRMVWELERAGASAIELEDQVAPKRASHHRDIEHLVSTAEMVGKVRFAVEARTDPDLVLIARTGAVQNEDFDSAITRLEAYLDAGADAVMLLPADEDQLAEAPRRLGAPLATLTSFDSQSQRRWQELGYALVIDPITGETAAFDALRRAYDRQRRGEPSGTGPATAMALFRELHELARFEELYEVERATTEPAG
ncbi:MAG: isocitrate lyase/PEP mutase family protein [Pseudonocardia sp.]|uniref:isocitrate lyase/PEP mutase family protein n=1 Tax=unclassified Pseudonocardia TaxID=2619320 RepID=UPI00086CE744|nr:MULTISPECIES: isocitrate lyase/PEP mutase family protein [unclassified Pseudonocardia]MBN9108321.1 isocitrate lyase/PEP mutase family protein [Pseudonocardia sp.]ODU30306.1 MAG: carboxyvinyl-carboxyphosphonate phosphorylmutase [Pseudonocardia sp. SCN 72-51]ODV08702.1 MAG: carboxyvinyl-carboxyphosphonate phosphorylmutase [Pseudonocardia sp. SCN 73-27]